MTIADRIRRSCRYIPHSPTRATKRRIMEQIFGDTLPPKMTVGEFRRRLFENENLLVVPAHVALVRGHWDSEWLERADPKLTRVLRERIARYCHGGSRAA